MDGARLRRRRKELRLSGQDIANQLNTTRVTVSRWESGVSEPDDATKFALAKILNTSVSYLVGETDNPDMISTERPVIVDRIKSNYKNEKSLGLSYWGEVVDNMRDLATSGNRGEISLVYSLLSSGLDVLVHAEKPVTTASTNISGVDMRNSNNVASEIKIGFSRESF